MQGGISSCRGIYYEKGFVSIEKNADIEKNAEKMAGLIGLVVGVLLSDE
jgi:hypothetical protein